MNLKPFVLLGLFVFVGLTAINLSEAFCVCTDALCGTLLYSGCGGANPHQGCCGSPQYCNSWQKQSYSEGWHINACSGCCDVKGCVPDYDCCDNWCKSSLVTAFGVDCSAGPGCTSAYPEDPTSDLCAPMRSSSIESGDYSCWCYVDRVINGTFPPFGDENCCLSGKRSLNERTPPFSYCCSNTTPGDTFCDASKTNGSACWYYTCVSGNCVPDYFADKYFATASYTSKPLINLPNPVQWVYLKWNGDIEGTHEAATPPQVKITASTDGGITWTAGGTPTPLEPTQLMQFAGSPHGKNLTVHFELFSDISQQSTYSIQNIEIKSMPRLKTVNTIRIEGRCEPVERDDLFCNYDLAHVAMCLDNSYNGTFAIASLINNGISYSEINPYDNVAATYDSVFCRNQQFGDDGDTCYKNTDCASGLCCSVTKSGESGTCIPTYSVDFCGFNDGEPCVASADCASGCCSDSNNKCCPKGDIWQCTDGNSCVLGDFVW